MDNNLEIKKLAKDSKVALWKLADFIGITEFTLSRRLRRPLSVEDAFLYKSIILHIRKEEDGGKTYDQILEDWRK